MATTPSLAQTPDDDEPARLGICPKLAYFMMFVGVLGLGLSGIGTFLAGRAPMTQWILMGHVGASPVFSIGLALVALTWPTRSRHHNGFARFFLWCVLLSGLVVILSGVVPMTPVFGTEGQHFLYLVHRYGAIALAGLVVLHLLGVATSRK